MSWSHIALATKSTLLILTAFIIVVLVRLAWTEWSGGFTIPFLRTGNYAELIILFMVGGAVAIAMTKLLQWEFRLETRPRKRRGRR